MISENAYFMLFIDSVLSAFMIPFGNYSILVAMKIFGSYSTFYVASASAAGSATGYFINYVIGLVLFKYTEHKYIPNKEKINLWLSFLSPRFKFIFIPAIPFLGIAGSMCAILYGYIRYNIIKFIVSLVSIKFGYNLFFLLN